MYLDINPLTNIVRVANRIEELPIYAIQTFNNNPTSTDDIFNPFIENLNDSYLATFFFILLLKL